MMNLERDRTQRKKDDERRLEEAARLRVMKLRPWQQHVVEKILNAGEREIVYVVDPIGGMGKKWVVDYLEQKHPELRLLQIKAGKSDTMHNKIAGYDLYPPRCVVVEAIKGRVYDAPGVLEDCKRGVITGTKWRGGRTVLLRHDFPAVMFLRHVPDLDWHSLDRFHVVCVVGTDDAPAIYTLDTTGFPSNIFPSVHGLGPSRKEQVEVARKRVEAIEDADKE